MRVQKPIFALDLSNEGIALWHRKGSQGWIALGQVTLEDPHFELRLIEMRDKAPVRGRATVVRIPRDEVLMSRVRLGAFEGEAAVSHARKQVADLTDYDLEEISYDLGEKGFGNMAPVGIVARKTLREAESFARRNGFEPVYFTTRYSDKEFPREPRFFLDGGQRRRSAVAWAVPWAAAAAVGLTAGFLGYSWLSSPGSAVTTALDRPAPQTPVASGDGGATTAPLQTATGQAVDDAAPPVPDQQSQDDVSDATGQTEVASLGEARSLDADGLSEVAPALPPVAPELLPISEGSYPGFLTQISGRMEKLPMPAQLRLANLSAHPPAVVSKSTAEKTDRLIVADARRDLPEVDMDASRVSEVEAGLLVSPLEDRQERDQLQLARLTLPTLASDAALILTLPPAGESKAQVSQRVTALPDPPPPPVSLVQAEPGELTPTVDGTLGPENILIFAGRPDKVPPARPGSERAAPAPDPLAGFKPRLRPEALVSAEMVARFAPPVPLEELSEGDRLIATADPALREILPRPRPEGLVPEDIVAALRTSAAPAELPAPQEASAPQEDTETVQLSTPTMKVAPAPQPAAPVQARSVDLPPSEGIAQGDVAPQTVEENAAGPADDAPAVPSAVTAPSSGPSPPALVAARDVEPDGGPAAPTEGADLLALADPALAGARARTRPAALNTDVGPFRGGILALADPALKIRARPRPEGLRIPEAAARPPAGDPQQDARPAAGDELPGTGDTLTEGDADRPPAQEAASPVEADAASPQTTLSGDSLLALADPALAQDRAPARPETLAVPDPVAPDDTAAPQTGAVQSAVPAERLVDDRLLALADPSLQGKRARGRPADLTVLDVIAPQILLALADPTLRNNRARVRPASLRIIAPEPDPVQPMQEANGIATASRYAIAQSPQPRARPTAKISRLAATIERQQARDAKDTRTSGSTPRAAKGTSKPAPGPTATSVAKAATEKAKFSKSRMSLVGVFGSASTRRALVRMPTGRYVEVKTGDRLSGWQVSAIGESSLRISKGSRNQTLRVP